MRRELAAAIVQLVEEGKIDLDAPVTRYSNMAFDTLGDVIAKVSGQSFEEYEKTRILGPLGMNESTFI